MSGVPYIVRHGKFWKWGFSRPWAVALETFYFLDIHFSGHILLSPWTQADNQI